MAHPEPSSRLFVQYGKGTQSAPLLNSERIGGVGGGVKGVWPANCFRTKHVQGLDILGIMQPIRKVS